MPETPKGQMDVRTIGDIGGYDIEKIKRGLDEAKIQLKPGSVGGVFIAGTASAFRQEVLVAIVQKVGDDFVVGLKVKASSDAGVSVGFSLQYEW